jgi:hypothetical protein
MNTYPLLFTGAPCRLASGVSKSLHLFFYFWGEGWRWGVRSHAPCVGSHIAFTNCFVVLRVHQYSISEQIHLPALWSYVHYYPFNEPKGLPALWS